MKLFSDHEFTLVTKKSLADCAETLRQITLYAELTGSKVKKKKRDDGTQDDRSFAYKYHSLFVQLHVAGTVEPYEQPYTGCRIPVSVTEGADTVVMNMFIFYVVLPLWLLGSVLEQEYGMATVLLAIIFGMLSKAVLADMKAKKKVQDLLARIFDATVELPKKEHHEET